MAQQLSLLDLARRHQPGRTDAERVGDIAAGLITELDERPPVRLEVVASFRDIPDIRIERIQTAASLTPEATGLVMRLRAQDSRRRRRFSGFHEVGHTFQPGFREQTLFRCAVPSLPRRASSDPETLADVAAAEMLLPRAYFSSATRSSAFEIASITDLADAYDASVQSTAYRFAAFWPEPTLVLALEMGLRKEQAGDQEAVPALRAVSAWPRPKEAWPFIPVNKSADANGALVRAFGGEIINEVAGLEELGLRGPEQLELTAQAFEYRGPTGPRRRVLALFRQTGGDDG